MQIKSITLNLPVNDLSKSREFWTKLGFSFNETFSDDKAICLMLNNELISAMLITKEFFSTFTNRKIADNTTTQVLIAIEVESREKVDEVIKTAIENGATKYSDKADYGWMYYGSFADLDGHQWEVMYSDPSKLEVKESTKTKITIQATVEADLKKAWDVYTNPDYIVKWNFASDDWCCPVAKNDMRVGGKYFARMEAKDGSAGFDFEAIYDEVIENQKISYNLEDGRNVVVLFKAEGNSTLVTVTFDAETENSIELQKEGWQAILNNYKKCVEKV